MSTPTLTQNQLVKPSERLRSIRELLDKSKPQLQMALPKHLTVDRLMRVAITSIQRTPKLLECDQISLLGAVMQAAQLGLEPDGVLGHAYLIPFWNGRRGVFEVQFLPGYKGLIDLARRSGQVDTVEARVVRSGDIFQYEFGLIPKLVHKPKFGSSAGEAIAVYAVAGLKSGARQFDVMSIEEVNAIRERSRAKDNGPWVTDYEEMAKKTVLRRLCKLLPASVELQRAVALDELAERGVPQELDVLALPQAETTVQEQASQLDQLADRIKAEDAKPSAEASTPKADEKPAASRGRGAKSRDREPGEDDGPAPEPPNEQPF
jgi:recombination protein RecT